MLEIEIHDDEWDELDWLPDDAYETMGSTISINWTRIRVTDPKWIMFARLKYPWINWLDEV